MQTSNTALFFLEDDCIRAFGQETGCTLLQQAEELYQDLCQHGNDRGNHVIEEHLQSRLFPLMSYYKALLKHGIQEDQALLLVRETAHKAAIDKKAEMQKLGSLPFAYLIFRMGVKRHMKNHFPPEGWQTEWMRCDCQEIHFNLHRCLYWDVTKQFGCPELCCVFCESDDISFSGLAPKINFLRNGTLGSGSDCCDLHFIKAQ